MSHLLKGKPKPRDQPASSPPASHASLSVPQRGSTPGHGGSQPTAGPSKAKQPLTSPSLTTTTTTSGITPGIGGSSTTTGAGAGGLNIPLPAPLTIPVPSLRSRESTRATDRTDALWAEMQATLEAIELSAAAGTNPGAGASGSGSGSTAHVFGPDHERKLDELRAAQIALAQAWARSEADEAIETTTAAAAGGGGAAGGVGEAGVGGLSEGRSVGTDGGGGGSGVGRSTAGTGSARPGSSGLGIGGGGGGAQEMLAGGKMEEETEVDILLARKRREANDRYFQRVNQGVLDVVAKLEDVAIAMRAVEQESKELWGEENESVPGSAKT